MARRRHTPEQIIRKLREGEKLFGEHFTIEDVCKHLESPRRVGTAGRTSTVA